jgi:hypothetical protein
MWKIYRLTPDDFNKSWLPFVLLMQYRHYELFIKPPEEKENDSDEMSINQLKAFFSQSGIQVKD